MRVALIGGTGFVGSYIIDALLAAGHQPVVLVRPGSEHRVREAGKCTMVGGSLADRTALATCMRDCDAAIYLIGILREQPSAGITFDALQNIGARICMDVALEQGVKHFVLMSANGACGEGTAYQRSKYAAEQYLAESDLRGTVFRPSVIYGDPRGCMEFCTQLRDQMIRPPLPAPVFFRGLSPARGGFSLTPVHVEDVASAFVASLQSPASVGQIFPLGGNETLSWPAILRRIANASGKRKILLPVPAVFVRLACVLLDRFSWFPITRDQLDMLLEGNVVESQAAFKMFGIAVRGMHADELRYLQSTAQ
ncbi:MAG: NAD(P)H-binding protein [Woeseia sp.]